MTKPPRCPPAGLPDKDTLLAFLRDTGSAEKTDIARHFGLKGADRRALRENNIDEDPGLVFNAGMTIAEGAKAAEHFLEEQTKATAVQTVNDLVAIGAANVLLERGLKTPDDLSMAGFGNILTSEHYRVPLTTVRQPKFRLGMAAFDTMLKLLAGERPESQRIVAEVLVRQSTGPVAK